MLFFGEIVDNLYYVYATSCDYDFELNYSVQVVGFEI